MTPTEDMICFDCRKRERHILKLEAELVRFKAEAWTPAEIAAMRRRAEKAEARIKELEKDYDAQPWEEPDDAAPAG